jgi:hypothetical protein
VTPPDPPDDPPAGGSDPNYERVFADLFRRFWRGPEPAEAAPTADIEPQD